MCKISFLFSLFLVQKENRKKLEKTIDRYKKEKCPRNMPK